MTNEVTLVVGNCDDIENIAGEMEGTTPEEVTEYSGNPFIALIHKL